MAKPKPPKPQTPSEALSASGSYKFQIGATKPAPGSMLKKPKEKGK